MIVRDYCCISLHCTLFLLKILHSIPLKLAFVLKCTVPLCIADGLLIWPPGYSPLQRVHVFLGRNLPGVLEAEDGHPGPSLGLHGLPWRRGLAILPLTLAFSMSVLIHLMAFRHVTIRAKHSFVCPEVRCVSLPVAIFYFPLRSVLGQSSQPWPPLWSKTQWQASKSPTFQRRPGCPACSLAPWSSSWWWDTFKSVWWMRLSARGQSVSPVSDPMNAVTLFSLEIITLWFDCKGTS